MQNLQLMGVFVAVFLAAQPVLAQDIGVLWRGKSGTATKTFNAFQERLSEIAPEFQLEVKSALPDVDAYKSVYERYQGEKAAIVSIRSNGKRFIATNKPRIPTVVGGGNNPQRLGAVESLIAPTGMVTGTSIALPTDVRFEIISALFPDASNILVIGEYGHPSTDIDVEEIPPACEALFLTCTVQVAATPEAVADVAKANIDGVDLVILNRSNQMQYAAKYVLDAVGDVPVAGSFRQNVEEGVLAALETRVDFLARTMADQLVSIVRDNKPISQIPVVFDRNPLIMLNVKGAAEKGITFPRAMLLVSETVE